MRQCNTPTLALARQSLAGAMIRLGWPPADTFDAQLALGELISNAWNHANTPAPVVQILSVTTRTLRVGVSDESPVLPSLQPVDLLAESGRGLHLVAALTARWGVDRQERGKTIWFECELDGAA
ncbi:ATP-binding protein [Kitasatospora sp. NPDC089509]|uniref:ATP-binding protein n=1 Tax=Kitasatospora sp. NPDC089509 TaxID=3364079 RepID=UPI00381C9757